MNNANRVKTSEKHVRKIMGSKNFFGLKEWQSLYGANFVNKKKFGEVPDFPWSEDVLNAPCPFVESKRIRETHFVFLGLPIINDRLLTIFGWHEIDRITGSNQMHYTVNKRSWDGDQKFATGVTCDFRWYLILQEIVPNSVRKTLVEQIAMLPTEYEAPHAIEEFTKNILCFKKKGVRLNSSWMARTLDVTSSGWCVEIGGFNVFGFSVNLCSSDEYPGVGLAASRKLPD